MTRDNILKLPKEKKKEQNISGISGQKTYSKYIPLNFTLQGKCYILNRKYISVITMNISNLVV